MKGLNYSLGQVGKLTIKLEELDRQGKDIKRLKKALQKAPGVMSVYISSSTEVAYIIFDSTQTNPEQLYKIVQDEDIRIKDAPPVNPARSSYSEP